MSDDPLDLARFVRAQAHGTHESAIAEVRRGRKTSHWMWFVYPQVAGLGHSPTAVHYAIGSLAEARAYLAHPELGPRLVAAMRAAAEAPGRSADTVFGGVDALKLRSSATLFLRAAPDEPAFQAVLDRWFDGEPDAHTDRLLD